ncbi:dTDP-4-dehydrorhamnose reductase [Halorutilales archaeon Cl-col2-1]
MRILVLGSNGLLGSNVVTAGLKRSHEMAGTYHSEKPGFETGEFYQLDITDIDSFSSIFNEIDPDVVINCAAMTDVDGCERDPERAFEVNSEAPEKIASVCEGESDFVHISTDYVFDGENESKYSERDSTNPIQVYGESKLEGEKAVMEKPGSLALRLSFVYGVHRSKDELEGFPAWVSERIRSGEETPLFTDQHITPSRAGQVADVLLELIENNKKGLYHVASKSCVTPYEFGEILRQQMDASEDILEESSLSDINREAERPRYTCLDVSKLENELERKQPSLEEDIEAVAEWL